MDKIKKKLPIAYPELRCVVYFYELELVFIFLFFYVMSCVCAPDGWRT